MRHGKKFNHLGRTSSHRKALLSNLASSLILNKRLTTTVAKAKALRKFVEPLLTKSKDDSTTSRRVVFSYLQNKDTVNILFREIAGKIADRPGGYTRIIKLLNRQGDNAEMAMIELVDYNELLLKDTDASKAKKTTRRRGAGTKAKAEAAPAKAEKAEKTPKVEAKTEAPVEITAEVVVETPEEVKAPESTDESAEENKD